MNEILIITNRDKNKQKRGYFVRFLLIAAVFPAMSWQAADGLCRSFKKVRMNDRLTGA